MAGLTSTAGVRLDRLRLADVAAAAALSASIGWNQDENDWRRLLTLHPRGAVAARRGAGEADTELVGTATLVVYGEALAWLGMVIVDPALRGQGVGTALMDAALATWQASPGAVIGLDATEFGAPLYRGRGFEPVATIDRWEGVLRRPERVAGALEPWPLELGAAAARGEGREDPPAGEVRVRRAAIADLPALVALDARETGVDRSRLLAYLADEPSSFLAVAQRGDEVVGHGALRSGRKQRHVGPLVVADLAAAQPLLSYLGETAAGATVFLDAQRVAGHGALLEAHGLSIARTLQRMTRPAAPVMDRETVIAATSFAWG